MTSSSLRERSRKTSPAGTSIGSQVGWMADGTERDQLTGTEKIRIFVSLVCLLYLGWLIFHGWKGR